MAQDGPEKIILSHQGKIKEVLFSDLKKVEVFTENYHPNFVGLGKIKYKGHRVSDILKELSLRPDEYVTIVGKTAQFSVELKFEELNQKGNIIATEMNGKLLNDNENGYQIIYSEDAIKKFPHLKQRQFWCWWVRAILLDDGVTPTFTSMSKEVVKLKSSLPWPVPYGITSRGELKSFQEREGYWIDNRKELLVHLLNGHLKTIPADNKTKVFLAKSIGSKEGSYSIHQIIEDKGSVHNFVANIFYVKSVEVSK